MQHDVHEADHQQKDHDQHQIAVEFYHVASLQDVKFKANEDWTLQHTWNKAYEELHEERRADDHLQTADGKDVTPYLDMTLKHLYDHHILKEHKFQIVGPTGGA